MRIKLFWRSYMAAVTVALLVLPLLANGPAIELALNPVRSNQVVTVIERSETRLCWTWAFRKERSIASPDIDVFVDTPLMRGASMSIFDRDTGMPWGLQTLAVPPGPHSLNYCVLLPPYVKRTDPVRVRQTARYPGMFGLWDLRVTFPDVVDPAEAVFP